MTRIEAAKTLVSAIDATGLDSSLWNKGQTVRVYVNTDASKKAKECGYLQIEADGSITQQWTKRRFDLERVVAEFRAAHTIDARVDVPVSRPVLDEDELDQVVSAERIAQSEVV